MSSQEIEEATTAIRSHIVDFLTTLDNQMDAPRLSEIVEADGTLQSKNLDQTPERCVEVCGARSDTGTADETQYPASRCWLITFRYCFCLEQFGVKRCRSTVHNWVQKADLQPTDGKDPNQVAVDETVIQLNDQRYWLYAAIDPQTDEFLHVKLYSTRTIVVTKQFLTELTEKHRVGDATTACRP